MEHISNDIFVHKRTVTLKEKFKLLNLREISDDRGNLMVFEKNMNCPFEIKRAFFMYSMDKNAIRGCHANRNSQFLLVAVHGDCKVTVQHQNDVKTFILDTPSKGLFIDTMVWKEIFDFSDNCVLLVLSSENYNPNEYIRDKNEYLCKLGI